MFVIFIDFFSLFWGSIKTYKQAEPMSEIQNYESKAGGVCS